MPKNAKPQITRCPCKSRKPYNLCCEPVITGETPAATAEALMRSRYTAFVLGLADYLIETLAAEHRQPNESSALTEQIRTTRWIGLKIIDVQAGTAQDTEGEVEFEARFQSRGERGRLRERSRFRREAGRWVYVDGDFEVHRN